MLVTILVKEITFMSFFTTKNTKSAKGNLNFLKVSFHLFFVSFVPFVV